MNFFDRLFYKIPYKKNRRILKELNWASIFNSAITDSEWLKNKSFNPGRWAAGYPMLYILYRIYNEVKPKNILELGLGESTKMAYQYKKANNGILLTIIEQDKNWLNFFSNQVYNISAEAILLPIEQTVIKGHKVNVYKDLIVTLPKTLFNLIIVDGPWGSKHFSRHQIIDKIEHNFIADDFILIIDDYERRGEWETAKHIRKALSQKEIQFHEKVYSGAKRTLLICSTNYSFLTTL
jgi:hypothetical protein